MGAEAFARRAERELLATGEHARNRTVDTLGELTPQEVQISRLVAQGYTNREIAALLFITTCAGCSASSASSRATQPANRLHR